MKTEYDFFDIEIEQLKGKRTFPFQIFIFNPTHKKYSLFLNGNRPMSNELESFLNFLIEKGGRIAILRAQRRTFLTAQKTHESEIPSLAARELHELEKERIMHIKLKEMYDEKNTVFSFQSEFEKACTIDNFEVIIDYAKLEILTFSVTQSPTVSLAIHLAKTHLEGDNFLNRIVATSYWLAKNANIKSADALSDIVCGAYLSHIGFSQLPLTMLRTPVLNLSAKERSLYEKHTILGNHLLKKGQLDISDRCKQIIHDHHERTHGGGYPSMKSGESIESLSLIVGSVAHLFEFSSGKINGNKQPIKSILFSMKNKNFSPGLEFDFGEKIFTSLVTLINTDKIDEKNNDKIEAKKAA